jgi:far upstream element-binding protein
MAPSMMTSYGNQGPNKKIEIPNGKVGVIIGKGGETIKYLQLQSGAKIQITRDMDADPNSTTRAVELVGTSDQIARAEQLINDVLAEADSGGAGRRMTGQPGGSEQFVMKVPTNKVGLVIGKGGETIKTMQATSGARIQVIPLHPPPGDTSTERTVQIDGSAEQIEAAKQLVNEVVNNENRGRNQAAGGGYSQQGYQTQQQASWAPPAQQQNYGYGYNQAQYSTPQQAYPNTGYPPAQQTATQAGGGDYSNYYNQPPPPPPQQQITPPGGPTDNTSAYNYSTPGYGNPANQTAAAAAAMYQQGGYYNYPQAGYAQMPYAAQYAAGSYYGGGGGGYQQPPGAAYSGDGSAGGTYDSAPPAAAPPPAQPAGPAKTSPQS